MAYFGSDRPSQHGSRDICDPQKLQYAIVSARLSGYASALKQKDDPELVYLLTKAAALLENVWVDYQRQIQQKAREEND